MDVRMAISLPWCAVEPDALEGLPLGRCSIGSESPGFTIDPMGYLRACSMSATVLGDLKAERWEEIAARAARGYLLDVAALPELCASCDVRSKCGGGCRESAFIRTGTFASSDPLARIA
jgi:radical SAM protein with 4Fe4S-binding SPASM domain